MHMICEAVGGDWELFWHSPSLSTARAPYVDLTLRRSICTARMCCCCFLIGLYLNTTLFMYCAWKQHSKCVQQIQLTLLANIYKFCSFTKFFFQTVSAFIWNKYKYSPCTFQFFKQHHVNCQRSTLLVITQECKGVCDT